MHIYIHDNMATTNIKKHGTLIEPSTCPDAHVQKNWALFDAQW